MPFFDLPLDQLETYNPPIFEPADFDAFWAQTLNTAREYPLDAVFTPFDEGLKLIETYDVTFAGYGGQPIKAWYLRPAGVREPLPCIVEYNGYGGGRAYVSERLFWAAAGFAYFFMDTRGQGGTWSPGDTPDLPDGANPSVPGFMTQGIFDPATYYYRRLFTDAARAVEAVRSRDDVDGTRIALTGGSQGGGITLAASALVPDVALCMPDVPFLCHFRRAITLVDTYPYAEIGKFLAIQRTREDQVLSTLDYFDGVNFARRIQAKTLVSVGLMDTICPPSTVYAAYNAIPAPKDIAIYKYNNHEGGAHLHLLAKLKFVQAAFGG